MLRSNEVQLGKLKYMRLGCGQDAWRDSLARDPTEHIPVESGAGGVGVD